MTRWVAEPSELYHYTCDHGIEGIRREGVLWPGADGFVWLTDMATPNREALGLTSHILSCDRTAHRVVIRNPPSFVVPWMTHRWDVPWMLRQGLESVPGVRPRHWFIATRTVDLDPLDH